MQIYYFFFIHANLSPIFSKKSHKVPFLTRIFPFKRLCLPAFAAYNKNNAPTAKHSQESGRRSFFWWSRFFLFHISKSSTLYQICCKWNNREKQYDGLSIVFFFVVWKVWVKAAEAAIPDGMQPPNMAWMWQGAIIRLCRRFRALL